MDQLSEVTHDADTSPLASRRYFVGSTESFALSKASVLETNLAELVTFVITWKTKNFIVFRFVFRYHGTGYSESTCRLSPDRRTGNIAWRVADLPHLSDLEITTQYFPDFLHIWLR